jgi:dipeptidase E
MLNLALTSDFPSTPSEAVAARLRVAATVPRVAWVAPQSSLATRTRFLAAQLAFRSLGVDRLEYCAIDSGEESMQLDQYDAIYLTGGDPLLFQRNIQRNNLASQMRDFIASSRLVVASSGGAMQLTINVSLFRLQTSTLDEVLGNLVSYEGLSIVPFEVLPHLNRHDDIFLEKVRLYSEFIPHSILALADGAAVVYVDGAPAITGKAAKFLHGVRQEVDSWSPAA